MLYWSRINRILNGIGSCNGIGKQIAPFGPPAGSRCRLFTQKYIESDCLETGETVRYASTCSYSNDLRDVYW